MDACISQWRRQLLDDVDYLLLGDGGGASSLTRRLGQSERRCDRLRADCSRLFDRACQRLADAATPTTPADHFGSDGAAVAAAATTIGSLGVLAGRLATGLAGSGQLTLLLGCCLLLLVLLYASGDISVVSVTRPYGAPY